MKRHGRYDLPTPEELLLDCAVDGCSTVYVTRQLQRHKQKYHNDKRHREKTKNRNKRNRYEKI